MRISKIFIAILIISLQPLFSISQETTSEIVGSVSSGEGGLAGATVTALNVPTGTKTVTTTRSEGRYNLPNLKVGGPYLITVSYVGFETSSRDSIYLSLGQEFRSDF